jgi:hypothetical protein
MTRGQGRRDVCLWNSKMEGKCSDIKAKHFMLT